MRGCGSFAFKNLKKNGGSQEVLMANLLSPAQKHKRNTDREEYSFNILKNFQQALKFRYRRKASNFKWRNEVLYWQMRNSCQTFTAPLALRSRDSIWMKKL